MINHKHVISLLVLVLMVYGSFSYGLVKGSSRAESEYLLKIIETSKEYEDKIKAKELAHIRQIEKNTLELNKAKKEYEENITHLVDDYDSRLLISEERANRYREQAENSSPECRAIASHTTKLDRTLEEGRYLVGELTETIRLYESQLILLGKQLREDRVMINN